jgi:predicted nucleic acid binding AN1-type Zn finger protein
MDRCYKCKKLSLTLIKCKCGDTFCILHRLPEKHSCNKLYEFGKIAYDRNEELLNKYAIKRGPNIDQIN